MGKPLVRFWEGQESPTVWTRYCGTAAKAGGKRRRRTSSCSGGRLLPTRSPGRLPMGDPAQRGGPPAVTAQ